jgi:hypothetical protein
MATPINSTKGAELIEAAVAPRRCSRQNLEKLCDRGALLGSPCILQAKPLRVDADILVSEYLARVGQGQSEAQQPAAKREPLRPPVVTPPSPTPAPPPPHIAIEAPQPKPPPSPPAVDVDDVPSFNDERALHEREKRLIAEMDRKIKAGQLAYIEDMEMAYNAVLLQLTTKAGSLHKQIKAAIPHLKHKELEKIERMIADVFESVATHAFEQLPK